MREKKGGRHRYFRNNSPESANSEVTVEGREIDRKRKKINPGDIQSEMVHVGIGIRHWK